MCRIPPYLQKDRQTVDVSLMTMRVCRLPRDCDRRRRGQLMETLSTLTRFPCVFHLLCVSAFLFLRPRHYLQTAPCGIWRLLGIRWVRSYLSAILVLCCLPFICFLLFEQSASPFFTFTIATLESQHFKTLSAPPRSPTRRRMNDGVHHICTAAQWFPLPR